MPYANALCECPVCWPDRGSRAASKTAQGAQHDMKQTASMPAHRLGLPVEGTQQPLAALELAVLAVVLVPSLPQPRVGSFHGCQRGAGVLQLLGQHLP
jgi:hypothetical protein